MPSFTPIGRFAPSPTGRLHLGSLVTAVASFCHIRSIGGLWRLRIEDTDFERCHANFSTQILKDLETLGLCWDGEVLYQSKRVAIYHDFLHSYLQNLCYECQCSRKEIALFFKQYQSLPKHIYPRRCLQKQLSSSSSNPLKTRLQLPNIMMGFIDGIQGWYWSNPQLTLGDVVVRRQNGMINYILACAIDDGLQEVTHVMRGLDILPMTTTQIYLLQTCQLPQVSHWYHLPLLCNAKGQKLSKQNLAPKIDTKDPSQLLAKTLSLLQQPKVDLDTPERMLNQAINQWDYHPLLGQQTLPY